MSIAILEENSFFLPFTGTQKQKGNNPFGSFPLYHFLTPDSELRTSDSELFYLLCLIFAWAAAKRAIGTRNGEQLT